MENIPNWLRVRGYGVALILSSLTLSLAALFIQVANQGSATGAGCLRSGYDLQFGVRQSASQTRRRSFINQCRRGQTGRRANELRKFS